MFKRVTCLNLDLHFFDSTDFHKDLITDVGYLLHL